MELFSQSSSEYYDVVTSKVTSSLLRESKMKSFLMKTRKIMLTLLSIAFFSAIILSPGQAFNKQYSFTVPTDGRANVLPDVVGVGIEVFVGINIAGGPLETTAPISIASATYPIGLTTYVLPIISVVILGVAVVLLTLIYLGLPKQAKK